MPQLSAAAVALARVAADDEAVEALREATSEALHAICTLSGADQRSEAAELGRRLQARSRELRRDMTRTRRWKRDIPGALPVASGAAALASVAIVAAGPASGWWTCVPGWLASSVLVLRSALTAPTAPTRRSPC